MVRISLMVKPWIVGPVMRVRSPYATPICPGDAAVSIAGFRPAYLGSNPSRDTNHNKQTRNKK